MSFVKPSKYLNLSILYENQIEINQIEITKSSF